MKRTLSINLGGLVFNIDEDAYQELKKYLEKLKQHFSSQSGGMEIIHDIEIRMAELFRTRMGTYREVVTITDVQEVIKTLGYPEDMYEEAPYSEPLRKRRARLYRDSDDRILGGVCSGIAAYFGTNPWIIRAIFIVAFFVVFGGIIYLILWMVVPMAQTVAEKLEMRGEPVNLRNIKDSVKSEVENIINKVK